MALRAGQEIKPGTSARGGPAGAEITVTMEGLLPFQQVRLGFGSLSQYEVLGGAESDAEGRLSAAIKVPAWAELDRVHYFVVSVNRRRIMSEPFHVTDRDGTAHITGTITAQPISCLTVEGRDKALYALQGETGLWQPGQHVLVTGTIAPKSDCGGGGLPITVREIQAL